MREKNDFVFNPKAHPNDVYGYLLLPCTDPHEFS